MNKAFSNLAIYSFKIDTTYMTVTTEMFYTLQSSYRKGLWNNEINLVFTDELGGSLPQTTVEHRFKRVCESIGLDRHFHDLRHTFATEGLRLGIPVKTVSEELGHYSSAFTMDVYGHTTTQMQQEAAQKLQASLDARLGNA